MHLLHIKSVRTNIGIYEIKSLSEPIYASTQYKEQIYLSFLSLYVKSELPRCEAVHCSIPRDPGAGKALFTSVSYKSTVSYECNYGYMVVGDLTR